MRKNWHKPFILFFLVFYLAPLLELDAKEYKANYSKECHQYVNCKTEQNSVVAKTIKQPVQQEFNFTFLPELSLETAASSLVFLPDDPLLPQKIFLLNSILII